MGVLTACLGGILRDLLADEATVLLRQELYVTAAAASASLMVTLNLAGVVEFAAAALAATFGFSLRAGAIARGWSLPTYRR
jgi:uncharacterized membrane protein YeiH